MTKRIVRLIKVKNTLSAKVLQNVKIHQKKTSIKKKIDKNENDINKQLTEIRHNKRKIYLQSKNLERNRNQTSSEVRLDVHQWPRGTVEIIRDSMASGLKDELLSNKKHQVKVRCCRGATIGDMFDYFKPILKRKPDYVVLHLETNNAKGMTSRYMLDKFLQLKTTVLDSDKKCKVILSQSMTRVDDGKAGFTISKLNDLLKEMDIPIAKNRNIPVDNLGSKGLHLNTHGIARFAMNLKASIRKL